MTLHDTSLRGLFHGHLAAFTDHRGLFSKIFGTPELGACWRSRPIKQINFSETHTPGTVRGMHYQNAPHAEMKVIVCLAGQVYDVAVDLRAHSKTFRQHVGLILSPLDFILIPEGCAHGFQALHPDAQLLYVHSADYAPDAEGGVRFDDKTLNITWPLPATNVSERDLRLPTLDDAFTGILPHD